MFLQIQIAKLLQWGCLASYKPKGRPVLGRGLAGDGIFSLIFTLSGLKGTSLVS